MSEEKNVLSNEDKMAIMGRMTGQPTPPQEKIEKPTETTEAQEKVENTEAVEKTEGKIEKTEEKPEFDLTPLNTLLGKNIESLDSLKSLFDKADSYDKTKSDYDDASQRLAEFKKIAEGVDPMSYFANEDEYVRQQFLKNNSDKLGEDAIKALSVLSPNKIKELDGIEALKINLMVNDGMSGEEAQAYLQRKYEVDEFNSDDLELGTRAAIKKDVNDAKRELGKLYDGINIPDKVDFETARTQLKESWETPLKELVNGIDKIQIEEGLDFVVTDDMKEGLISESMNEMITNGIKPSEDAASKLIGKLKDKIILNNIDKFVKSLKADLSERLKAETRADIHNDKPFKEDIKASEASDDNESKMKRFL